MTDSGDVAAVLSLRSRLAAIDLLEKDGMEHEPSRLTDYVKRCGNPFEDNDRLHPSDRSDCSADTCESLRSAEVLDYPMTSRGREAASFKSMMEQHHETMVQTTLVLFDELQTRLKASHDVQISSTESARAQREAQAQATVATLRTTLDDKTARGKVQKHLLMRLAGHHAAKSALHARRFGGSHSLLRIVHAWRMYSRRRALKALRYRQAEVLHRQRLPRQPFLAWRRHVQIEKHGREVEHHRTEHAAAIEALKLEHADDIQQLRDELKRAQAEIQVFQLEQVRLEEDVRRVFLRGVSAMNLEALSLFRHNPVHHPGLSSHDAVDVEIEHPRAVVPQPMNKSNQ